MKHLGDPHYFLGIEYSSGLFLSQTRYTTTDLLSKFHMSCANSVSTPIPVRSNLHSLFYVFYELLEAKKVMAFS